MTQEAIVEDSLQHLADLDVRTGSSGTEDSSPEDEKPNDDTDNPSTDPEPTLEELKVQLEESKAREKTLEQKFKSSEGRAKKEGSDRVILEELRDRIAASEKAMGLFITHGANGNEELAKELGEAKLEDAKVRNERVETNHIETLKSALLNTIYEDGESTNPEALLITKEQAAELVAKWKSSSTAGLILSLIHI